MKKSMTCPECGSRAITRIGKRNALYPGCLVILDLLFAIIHRLQSPVDYLCRKCGHRFARRNLTEKIALLALVLSLLFLVGVFIYEIFAAANAER